MNYPASILLLVLVVSWTPAVLAQPRTSQPCTLTLTQSPEIRRLRLGQPLDRLARLYPTKYRITTPTDDTGVVMALIEPIALNDPALLKGIAFISLLYLDGKLALIRVHYDNSIKWTSTLEFVDALTEKLPLPQNGWQGMDPRDLQCKGFTVSATAGPSSSVLVVQDTRLNGEVTKRRDKEGAARRAIFTP